MELSPVTPPAGWVSVFAAATRRPCEEQALVLKAMGLEHRVTEQPDGCHLLVPAALAGAAREQLGLYHRENPRRPHEAWPSQPPSRGVVGALLFALVIALAYAVQGRYALGVDWTTAGQVVAGEIRGGAWWRTVTALTLHADLSHVVGNMIFGGFFGYLAGQFLGSGVAVLVILATGAAGNLLNAFLQAPDHRSIGASTAVFAALGLVAACVLAVSRRFTLSWARRWSPVVGAVALLAYTGTGDEQTDIVAHLTGFLAGALGGWLLSRAPASGRLGLPAQLAAATAAGALLAVSWALALRALAL